MKNSPVDQETERAIDTAIIKQLQQDNTELQQRNRELVVDKMKLQEQLKVAQDGCQEILDELVQIQNEDGSGSLEKLLREYGRY